MDDIRFEKDKEKLKNSIKFRKFLFTLKKNWWKILIILVLMFIIIFPSLSGDLLGSWWNNFASSFLSNLTY